MLVDSTILVDLVRGREEAKRFLTVTDEKMSISRAGVMEIVSGSGTKKNLKVMMGLINSLGIEIVEISEGISAMAGDIFQNFWHSNGLGIMDAFIAATAIVENQKLATHNLKHFKFINGLDLIVPY